MESLRRAAINQIGKSKEQEVFLKSQSNRDMYIELACNAAFPMQSTGGKCPRCHEHAVSVELVQKRAADEGMTAVATCEACGHTYVAN